MPPKERRPERAVVTGLGVISPIGNSVHTFEQSLFEGRHGVVPVDHIDNSDLGVRVYAPVADLPPESSLPTREARRLDAFALFGLLAARQAVADSGIVGSVDPFRLGVFMSTGLAGVGSVLEELETMRSRGPGRVSPLLVPKMAGNMLAGAVAIDTGARGPALAHLAACASSAASIGEAVRAIRHGYADAVICGGAEAITQKLIMAGFENLRALSPAADPDRASIPFDRDRAGFVMGEGGAALVLESESHARARGATIYAEVSGYGITSDASHITAPAEGGEAVCRAITEAIDEAGEIDQPVHVNAHGTGTMLNDQVEASAIERVFGEATVTTSTKSMTGHMLGAAGAAEAIASVLSLRRGQVPATVGTVDVEDGMAIDVVRDRPRTAPQSRAVSLSLGFGGHNVALVIDRAA